MTELINNHFAVEVPSMAFGFDINNYANEGELMYMLSMEDISDEPNSEETLITKKLPPGNWQIVCTSKGATEAIAEKIVDKDGVMFKCYAGNRSHISPLRSLFCLMGEKGCDLNKTYLILKNP